MKRLFILFATVLCLCAGNKAIAQSFSAVNNDGKNIYYNITSSTPPLTVEVTDNIYNVYSGNITIPDSVTYEENTYSVTAIGDHAFSYSRNLTLITIPNTVITIGMDAFAVCEKLSSLTIPNSVTTIRLMAFSDCYNLVSVTLGSSVATIEYAAFSACYALTHIDVNPDNPIYSSIDGVLFNKQKDTLLLCPEGKAGNYTVPNSTVTIEERAFYFCQKLTSVTIGDSVTMIGTLAFFVCNGLTEIYVKAEVPPSLDIDAFYSISTSIPVYVLCDTRTNYRNAPGWKNFRNIIEYGVFRINLESTNLQRGIVGLSKSPCENAGMAVITAIPYHGYFFTQWSDGDTNNPRNVVITQDTTFWAEFGVTSYQITVLANDSTMGTVSGSGDYEANALIAIGAIPNKDYYFIQWSDGNKDNPRNITVTGNSTFTAIFSDHAEWMAHVSVFPHNPSMGEVSGSGYYDKNTIAIINATAYHNHCFVCWNDGNTDNPRFVTVTEDTIFIASFEKMNAIEDIETKHIDVYPNPATDNISITLPENVSQVVFILYDMQGKILLHQEVSNQESVVVNKLAAGAYIYNLRTNKQIYQGKLIRK